MSHVYWTSAVHMEVAASLGGREVNLETYAGPRTVPSYIVNRHHYPSRVALQVLSEGGWLEGKGEEEAHLTRRDPYRDTPR